MPFLFDLIVLTIFALFMFLGWRKGLLLTLFGFASFFLSIILTFQLYPAVSHFLRQTQLYINIRDLIAERMGLSHMTASMIPDLPLPAALINAINANNNPETYIALKVDSLEGYVGGFIANIAINIIAGALVFLLVRVLLLIASVVLKIVGKLPVIRTFNNAGGLIAGALNGLAVVWGALAVFALFTINKNYIEIDAALRSSFVTRFFYDNNPILSLFLKI
ncbi:MAG: CvpA family protein [Defluviitaleaceae bacterium]|nr:CvpA family protein [Defluviitaleaceae bacterium]